MRFIEAKKNAVANKFLSRLSQKVNEFGENSKNDKRFFKATKTLNDHFRVFPTIQQIFLTK